eukprot:3912-Heterococcus_DN1.PRE.1
MLNMCIKVTPAPASDHMIIEVVGRGAHNLFDPDIDWRLTAKQADFTSARGGVALTSDPAAWGRVYSRGIFVAVDEVLKALRVAVNVRTQLTRGRHVLPTHPHPTPLHLLDRFLSDKQNHHVITAARDNALKPVMKSYHAKQLGTTVDRIVYAAEVCDERTAFVLEQLNLFVANNTGALEDKIDLDGRILEMLAKCPDYVPTATEAPYLAALRKYVAALSLNSRRREWASFKLILNVKATQLKQYCVQFTTSTVYLTGDLLQGGNWQVAAISILNALSATLS